MLNPSSVSRWIALAGAAGASMLISRQASATHWTTGTVQYSTGTYWTGVLAQFQVPPKPTISGSGQLFSIWPGLEGQDSTLIQPVLQWNQSGTGFWTMQNWFVPGNGGTRLNDSMVGVNPGDWIEAYVQLDTNNPGNGCVMSTGNNCNYLSVWIDFTLGYSAWKEWQMPQGPTWALGTVFELPFDSYASCTNFPVGTMQVTTYLYEYSSANVYTSITPNYTWAYPGVNYPFKWTNVSLNTPAGGHVYGNCMGMTYPWLNNNTSMLWLNEG